MKRLLLLSVTILCGTAALAVDVQPGAGLDKLKLFAGAWRSESENFDTPYSSAG